MVTIRPATAADAPEVSALMSEAFRDDPAWSVFFPDAGTRQRTLEAHYRRRVRSRPEWADIAVDDGRIAGAMLWEPPRSETRPAAAARSASRAVRTLLSRLPGGRGIAHTLAVEAYRPTEPHWYLHDIAASPRSRGKGIGSALLEHRLGLVDASTTTLAALEATTPDSRRLYERFGFEAVGQAPSVSGQASTIMVRRPRHRGAAEQCRHEQRPGSAHEDPGRQRS